MHSLVLDRKSINKSQFRLTYSHLQFDESMSGIKFGCWVCKGESQSSINGPTLQNQEYAWVPIKVVGMKLLIIWPMFILAAS